MTDPRPTDMTRGDRPRPHHDLLDVRAVDHRRGRSARAAAVDGELVTCNDEQALAAAVELLRGTGNVGLTRPIKVRTNHTTGSTQLSNGCQHCDALQSDFFIYHEKLMEVLSANGLDGLDHLTDADLPTPQWQQLHNRWNTGGS